MGGKARQERPNRKASIQLQVMLTPEEDEALLEMVEKEILEKTLLVKWALYRFSQDIGYRFPWDERYQVLSLRHKKK